MVGLIGRNGAGKSSLMKVIFGSLQAQNQSVRIDGVFASPALAQEGVINYLPQDSFLMDYLTMERLTEIFHLDPSNSQIEELRGIEKTKLGELSSGQKRLIEIVTVLFAPTKFSILDEPFSFLSPKLVEEIIPLIRERSKFKGIILSDHQYESVFKTCNKYHIVYNQTIQEIGAASDLRKFGYLSDNIH